MNLSLNRQQILSFLLVTPIICPPLFQHFSTLEFIYSLGLKLVILLLSAYFVLSLIYKHNSCNKRVLFLILFEFLLLFLTFFNKGNFSTALMNCGTILSLVLLCEMFKKNIFILISSLYYYLEFYLYLNLLTVLVYPQGFYIGYNNAYGFTKEFFLSSQNFFIFWILPAFYFGSLMKYKGLIGFRYELFLIFMSLLELFYGSGTGKIIVFLFVLYYFLPFKKLVSNPLLFIIIICLLFGLIVFGANIEIFRPILNLLGKDITFSNRNIIWENAIKSIINNPFGYGILPSDIMVNYLGHFSGGWIWLGATHAHNFLLNITFQSGFLGLGLFLSQIFITFKFIGKFINYKYFQISSISLFLFLLIGLTEYFTFSPLYLIIILPFYLLKGGKNNE